jgi:hypothetical protein
MASLRRPGSGRPIIPTLKESDPTYTPIPNHRRADVCRQDRARQRGCGESQRRPVAGYEGAAFSIEPAGPGLSAPSFDAPGRWTWTHPCAAGALDRVRQMRKMDVFPAFSFMNSGRDICCFAFQLR